MDRKRAFLDAVSVALTTNVATHPERYCYGLEGVPEFVAKLSAAFSGDYFSASGFTISDSIVSACKALGIKATYKAIGTYIGGAS